jgi:acetylglutamate kinase
MAEGPAVVKVGGAVAGDGAAALADVGALWRRGIPVVVVHGGGPEITRWSERVGLPARFVAGLRYSDADTVAVAEMALARVGKALAFALTRSGVPAVSLGGRDAALLTAEPLVLGDEQGHPVDVGLVGRIAAVRVEVLGALLAAGLLPVVGPVAPAPDGTLYNVNADDAAADVAAAMGARALVLCTDVPGILVPGRSEPLARCDAARARALVAEGVISGGMRPKVQACLRAVAGGVGAAWIVDGRRGGVVEAALTGDASAGTAVVAAS